MISLKNKSKGFTIVELLIVIVIIAILATLVIVTFTGIQAKARDSQRQTDINAVDSHLEAFYAENGAYPTTAQLSSSTWVAKYMKGLDPAALVSPRGTNIGTTVDPTGADADAYWYVPTQEGGTTACSGGDTTVTADSPNVDPNCAQFKLGATLESGGDFTKNSNT